jgi:chromosome partitioning protein
MKILACYSMKGGVGKTATAVNMAWFAAKSGKKTLLVDMDPQGASSFYFRVKAKKKAWDKRFFETYKHLLDHVKGSDYNNLDVLPAHLSFRHFDVNLSNMAKSRQRLGKILKGLKKEYDLIILDCPPTISLLSENVFHAADVILVPVIPTTLSERTLSQVVDFFKNNDLSTKPIIPFLSMMQNQKQMHKDASTRLKKGYKRLLKARIPFSADIEKMGEHRSPVGEFAKNRPAYTSYRNLWTEVRTSLEKL